MNNYFARVVLHRVDGTDDYPELRAEMEKLGFVHTIRDNDPNGFTSTKELSKLPGGLYFFDNKEAGNRLKKYTSSEEVHGIVAKVVAKIIANDQVYVQDANNPPSILVTDSNDVAWSGLKNAPLNGISSV